MIDSFFIGRSTASGVPASSWGGRAPGHGLAARMFAMWALGATRQSVGLAVT